MRVKKHNSQKIVLINTSKYLINWRKSPSKGQQKLQNFLYPYLKNHIVLAEMRLPGSLMRFDIVDCTTHTIFEFSPKSHHDNYNPFFHRNRLGYLKSIKNSLAKEEWAEQNGFKLIHFDDSDLPLLSLEYIKEKFGANIL